MRTIERLTDATVRAATRPGLHADGAGLYLHVTARKRDLGFSKSWVVRYTAPDGRRREAGLGSYPEIMLGAARKMAAARRQQARDGTDPLAAKFEARRAAKVASARALTFRQCADNYILANERRWRSEKHSKQWRATLAAYAFPVFGDLPVCDVNTRLVIKVLEPIWSAKHETARRLRGRVEKVLNWATGRGHRDGPNPARWRGHLDTLLEIATQTNQVKHHTALPYGEIGGFLAQLRLRSGDAARALELVIFTGARTSEVIGAVWAEIDLSAKIWTVPAARMKGGREHRVPLSAPALRILADLQKDAGGDVSGAAHVFVNIQDGGALSNMAMLALLRRMGRDVTTHGFRSTFRDWAAERTSFPREVAEAALAHVVGDKVEAAYRRGDLLEKRRRLMNAWGAYCDAEAERAGQGAAEHPDRSRGPRDRQRGEGASAARRARARRCARGGGPREEANQAEG